MWSELSEDSAFLIFHWVVFKARLKDEGFRETCPKMRPVFQRAFRQKQAYLSSLQSKSRDGRSPCYIHD